MDLAQELTNRLVVAVEEQDVLFTLYWLNEIRKEKGLQPAINGRHSEKGHSALASIIQSPFSPLREIILQLLLLEGADRESAEVVEATRHSRNTGVLGILNGWKTVDSRQVKVPLQLLALPLPEAGDWIDQNLPEPENAAHLTGFVPLPEPDLVLEREPTTVDDTKGEVTAASVDTIPIADEQASRPRRSSTPLAAPIAIRAASASPVPTPTQITTEPAPLSPPATKSQEPQPEPSRRHDSPPRRSRLESPHRRRRVTPEPDDRYAIRRYSPRSRSRPRPLPESSKLVRVNVARFPVGWKPSDLVAMFADIGAPSKVILCHSTYWPTYAFLDVDRDDASRCIRLLEGTVQGDARIRCNYAGRQTQGSFSHSSRPLPPLRSPPPSTLSLRPPRSRLPPTGSDFHEPISPNPRNHYPKPAKEEAHGELKNVMIVNLPFQETDEARIVVNKLRNFILIRLSERDQAVAWLPNTPRGEHLFKLWDDYVVDGQRLKVVFAKDGLSPNEAIKDYFRSSGRDRKRERSEDSTRIGKAEADRARDLRVSGEDRTRERERERDQQQDRDGGAERNPRREREKERDNERNTERERERERERDREVERETPNRGRSRNSVSTADDDDGLSSRSRRSSRRSKRSRRSNSVESNTSYGPSPPPADASEARTRSDRASSRSSSKYKSPSYSSSRRHRERSSRLRN
ncbi:uncharacterized protein JCM15063_003159 [Sporobolomyces koalae]|uniref:uncharacterized protein n=1 Tax=Sporobolomyces koalae TaxID=500713 RepID=UPI00316F9876